jgi:hypothetical protein
MNLQLKIKYWLIKSNLFKYTFTLQGFVYVDKGGAPIKGTSGRIKWLEDVKVHCRYKDMDKNALAILYDKYPQYKGYINLF